MNVLKVIALFSVFVSTLPAFGQEKVCVRGATDFCVSDTIMVNVSGVSATLRAHLVGEVTSIVKVNEDETHVTVAFAESGISRTLTMFTGAWKTNRMWFRRIYPDAGIYTLRVYPLSDAEYVIKADGFLNITTSTSPFASRSMQLSDEKLKNGIAQACADLFPGKEVVLSNDAIETSLIDREFVAPHISIDFRIPSHGAYFRYTTESSFEFHCATK